MAIFRKKPTSHTPGSTAHVAQSGLAKKGGFKFKWWMAAILIVVVAGIGIAVLRFSRASDTVPATDYKAVFSSILTCIRTNDSWCNGAFEQPGASLFDTTQPQIVVPVDKNSLGILNNDSTSFFKPGDYTDQVVLVATHVVLKQDKSNKLKCVLLRNDAGQKKAYDFLDWEAKTYNIALVTNLVDLFTSVFLKDVAAFAGAAASFWTTGAEYAEKKSEFESRIPSWIQGEAFNCDGSTTANFGSFPHSVFDTFKLLGTVPIDNIPTGKKEFYRSAAQYLFVNGTNFFLNKTFNGVSVTPGEKDWLYTRAKNRILGVQQFGDQYPEYVNILPTGGTGNPLTPATAETGRILDACATRAPLDFTVCLVNPAKYLTPAPTTTSPPVNCVAGADQICATVPWNFLTANHPDAYWRNHDTGIWQSSTTRYCGVKSLPYLGRPKISNEIYYQIDCNYAGVVDNSSSCGASQGQICDVGVWDFLGGDFPNASNTDYGVWRKTGTDICGVKTGQYPNFLAKQPGKYWKIPSCYQNGRLIGSKPPVPTCKNGNIIKSGLLCDDGQWVADPALQYTGSYSLGQDYVGKRFVMYRDRNNRNICATKSGMPEGSQTYLKGYMYPISCNALSGIQSNIDQLNKWEQEDRVNKLNAWLGPRAFALQDVYPFQPADKGKPINTDPDEYSINMKTGNMLTNPFGWEKPTVVPPYCRPPACGFPNYFIADPHGLYSLGSSKGYNFFGNIWGNIDGRFVAGSNMGQYGKAPTSTTGTTFLYGPYENPGGNVWNATNGGKKVMKVCWTIKDLLADETNNTQHSTVRLLVTANAGGRTLSGGNGYYTLKGTDFSQYCQDNIRITQSDTVNLEYPVGYWTGSVAVSRIDRSIYWPSGNYAINLPSPGSFSVLPNIKDPILNQAGITNKNCYTPSSNNGCLVSNAFPLTIISSVLDSDSKSGKKEICVRVDGLFENQVMTAFLYGDNKNITLASPLLTKKVVLWDLSTMYCSQPNTVPVGKFKSLIIGTSASSTTPVLVKNVYVNAVN